MPTSKRGKIANVKGDFLVFSAMAMFGAYSLFLRSFPSISVLLFLFAFQAVGAIAFFFTCKVRGFTRINRRDLYLLVALAVVAVANDLFYFAAFRTTSVANASIAHQSVSLYLLLLAPWVLNERTNRNEWLALGPSVVGILVLYWGDSFFRSTEDFFGITLALLAGFFYAVTIVLYRVLSNDTHRVGINTINLWRYSISTVLLLPAVLFAEIDSLTWADMVPLTAFGLLFAFIAAGIHTYGMTKARSLHVSLIGKTDPVFAITYAFLFLNESPTLQSMIGGSLILGSSLWLATRQEAVSSRGKKDQASVKRPRLAET